MNRPSALHPVRHTALRAVFAGLLLTILAAPQVAAHCDTENGPVVTDAKKALAAGDVRLVLHWVKKTDEAVIIEAFTKTMAVRALSKEARELADRYFFETLVRVHRAGEGAPYTGLKPAETEIAPGIAAADRALADGSAGALREHLTAALQARIDTLFSRAVSLARREATDVEAGRRYVAAYVAYIHGIEAIVDQLESASPHDAHGAEPAHGAKCSHGEE